MDPVLQAPTRPAFAPTFLRLRCGYLLQLTRTASSCTNLTKHYSARGRRNFLAPCSSDIAPGELPSTALFKWVAVECVVVRTGPRNFKWIREGWQTFGAATNMSSSGLPSSKKAQRCMSPVAASLSPTSPEEDSASGSTEGLGPKIDLNLPRRRLQLSFTCDACGARSQRLINPDAYARGTVFVQCAGCEVYHRLVDNLGLIEEYDFRQETNNKADGADLNQLE